MALRSWCVPLFAAAPPCSGDAKRAAVEFARGVGEVRDAASAGAAFSPGWLISFAQFTRSLIRDGVTGRSFPSFSLKLV
uniref:Putative secreted protein n=1 Tax=Anopheles darlingi TaxID=43151 RepID=A0A2M4DI84_ANODA